MRSNDIAAPALLLALLVTLAGCGGGGNTEVVVVVSPSMNGAANTATPTYRWMPLIAAASYRVTVYGDAALTMPLDVMTTTGTCATATTALTAGQAAWTVVEALDAAGTTLARSAATRFRVLIPPPDIPLPRVTVHDTARVWNGHRLFGITAFSFPPDPNQNLTLVLVNPAGEIVWWYQEAQGAAEDVRVLPNGNLLLNAFDTSGGVFPGPTFAKEMTWTGSVVWQLPETIQPHHEISIGPDGDYMYLTYTHRMVGAELWQGDGIEIIDPATDQVVWQWDVFDHVSTALFDPIDILEDGFSGMGQDWTHANSAVWDPARSLIWFSIRHLDLILAIDYPSGLVVERFGKGELGGQALMSHQHAIEIQPDGSILFFDNGNRATPPVSRAVHFDWNRTAGTIAVRNVLDTNPAIYAFAGGDADMLVNGNVLATFSTLERIVEFTPNGDVVWDMELGTGQNFIYRAEAVPAHLIPPSALPFQD